MVTAYVCDNFEMLTTDLGCERPILYDKSPTFQWQIFDKNTAHLFAISRPLENIIHTFLSDFPIQTVFCLISGLKGLF